MDMVARVPCGCPTACRATAGAAMMPPSNRRLPRPRTASACFTRLPRMRWRTSTDPSPVAAAGSPRCRKTRVDAPTTAMPSSASNRIATVAEAAEGTKFQANHAPAHVAANSESHRPIYTLCRAALKLRTLNPPAMPRTTGRRRLIPNPAVASSPRTRKGGRPGFGVVLHTITTSEPQSKTANAVRAARRAAINLPLPPDACAVADCISPISSSPARPTESLLMVSSSTPYGRMDVAIQVIH